MLQRSCLDIQTRTGARADQEHWSSRIQDPVDLQVEKLRGADWAATAAVTVAAATLAAAAAAVAVPPPPLPQRQLKLQ